MDKEIIKYNLPQISLNVSSITYLPGASLRGSHYHSAIELIRVHSGKLTCCIDGSLFQLSDDDTLLINKNVVHNIIHCDFGTNFSYIQIEMDRQISSVKKDDMSYICQFIDKTSPARYFISNKKSELSDIFDNIFDEFRSKKVYYSLYLQAYILKLTAFMHRYELTKELDFSFLNQLKPIKPVIQFIDRHFADKIYICDVASTINLNKFQLCKRFKALTGGTVVEYINFVRLQNATKLLLSSDKTITEIACSCGFSSIQYFNKVFNENFGCSPKTFKNTSVSDIN